MLPAELGCMAMANSCIALHETTHGVRRPCTLAAGHMPWPHPLGCARIAIVNTKLACSQNVTPTAHGYRSSTASVVTVKLRIGYVEVCALATRDSLHLGSPTKRNRRAMLTASGSNTSLHAQRNVDRMTKTAQRGLVICVALATMTRTRIHPRTLTRSLTHARVLACVAIAARSTATRGVQEDM